MASVPLAVTVEIRAMDTGPRLVRVFRVTRAIEEMLLRFEKDLPFEAGRPVAAELTLPDDGPSLVVTGVVARAEAPATISIRSLDDDARRRLAAYVTERTRSP